MPRSTPAPARPMLRPMNVSSAMGTLFSGIDFQSRQGYAVAKIALDQQKTEGEAVADMIQQAAAVRPVSDPTGPSGKLVDTYA
jgi:hypothetical protein